MLPTGFEAINTLAVPVVAYSFNMIKWKMIEIKKLDRNAKTTYHPKNATPKGRCRQTLPTRDIWWKRPHLDRNFLPNNNFKIGDIPKTFRKYSAPASMGTWKKEVVHRK